MQAGLWQQLQDSHPLPFSELCLLGDAPGSYSWQQLEHLQFLPHSLD